MARRQRLGVTRSLLSLRVLLLLLLGSTHAGRWQGGTTASLIRITRTVGSSSSSYRRSRRLPVLGNNPLLLTMLLRGGEDDAVVRDALASDATFPTEGSERVPTRLVSILPLGSHTKDGRGNHNSVLLPAGCVLLQGNHQSASSLGNPALWQASRDEALCESLALLSDVVVLTVPLGPGDFNADNDALWPSPATLRALQRGWKRRQAQGLTPAGRLWIVAVDTDNDATTDSDAVWQTWYDRLVVDDWTQHLSSSTNGVDDDRLADWQVLRGVPAYTRALCDWLQQQQQQQQPEEEVNDDTTTPLWQGLEAAAAQLVASVYQAVGGRAESKDLFAAPPTFVQSSMVRQNVGKQLPDEDEAVLAPLPSDQDKEESSMPATVTPLDSKGDDKDDRVHDMVAEATTTTSMDTEPTLDLWVECEIIEGQLEDYWLDESSHTPKGPRLPPDLTRLLQPLVPRFTAQPATDVAPALAKLVQQHASILRDYYGRLAESLLQSGRASGGSIDNLLTQFQGAGQRVVDLALPGADDQQAAYQQQGQGLQADLVDLTEAWQATTEAWYEEEDEDDNDGSLPGRRRLPPWLRKLSSRALVLGINYLQGWIAWQGLQRAALARERQVPKFPLF